MKKLDPAFFFLNTLLIKTMNVVLKKELCLDLKTKCLTLFCLHIVTIQYSSLEAKTYNLNRFGL